MTAPETTLAAYTDADVQAAVVAVLRSPRSSSMADDVRAVLDAVAPAIAARVVPDGPKMLRETLCVAQVAIGETFRHDPRAREHMDRLQRMVDECDRRRPLGPDGKHGDRHTPTCGCDGEAQGAATSNNRALR